MAVVIVEHALTAVASKHFLEAYLGVADPRAYADLERWCRIYENTRLLWSSAVPASRNQSG